MFSVHGLRKGLCVLSAGAERDDRAGVGKHSSLGVIELGVVVGSGRD
jgi:hypothetical protein